MTSGDPPAPRGAPVHVPGLVGARGRDVLAGTVPPAQPRDAATVMLLRPGQSGPGESGPGESGPGEGGHAGLEVFLLRRPMSMAFAPGAYVFPGGSVDPGDADTEVGWAGPDPHQWADLLGVPAGRARSIVAAAVRETFEECGVLLAAPGPDAGPVSTTGPGWDADREAMLAGSLTLADLLRRRGLVLRTDLLRPWARWVTPVTEARRFDTWFFAAALPAGQSAHGTRDEADSTAWAEPGAALDRARAGEVFLLPPTAVSLADLAACGSVPAALTCARTVIAWMPEVSVVGEDVHLTLPPGVVYPL